jgi:hypothetical protein
MNGQIWSRCSLKGRDAAFFVGDRVIRQTSPRQAWAWHPRRLSFVRVTCPTLAWTCCRVTPEPPETHTPVVFSDASLPLCRLDVLTARSSNSRIARVAELADALDLGSCACKGVGVRLPPLAFLQEGPENRLRQRFRAFFVSRPVDHLPRRRLGSTVSEQSLQMSIDSESVVFTST